MPSSPQLIYDPTSIFAEHVQFLTSFNPDFHLDDSYKAVHHPEHVPSLFHRRHAQLAIIGENSPLGMDPLDWRYMYRPNRPFHYITNQQVRRTIAKLPPRPWLERKKNAPTDYYVEQMSFFNASPPPIPEEAERVDDVRVPGPLKVRVEFAWAVMVTLAWIIFLVAMILVKGLKWVGGKTARVYKEARGVPWEAVWFALAASQLLRFLPRMEGKEALLKVWKAEAPLYVVMIRNPNQLIRGAVVQG